MKALRRLFIRGIRRSWIRSRSESGQAATEFAFMLPLMAMFTFFIFQMSMVFTMAHQTSWASYAAARFVRVACFPGSVGQGSSCTGDNTLNGNTGQKIVDAILTGTIYQDIDPRWQQDQRGGKVTYKWDKMDTLLPYARTMGGCTQYTASAGGNFIDGCASRASWSVPTHLGRNTWQENMTRGIYATRGTKALFTDNNLDDDE